MNRYLDDPKLVDLRKKLVVEEALMRRGIFTESKI